MVALKYEFECSLPASPTQLHALSGAQEVPAPTQSMRLVTPDNPGLGRGDLQTTKPYDKLRAHQEAISDCRAAHAMELQTQQQ